MELEQYVGAQRRLVDHVVTQMIDSLRDAWQASDEVPMLDQMTAAQIESLQQAIELRVFLQTIKWLGLK